MLRATSALITCFLLVILTSCQEESHKINSLPNLMDIPPGFPDVVFPADNAFTEDRWALGKKLFFDPIMSVDSSISCASCHDPRMAFADDEAVSPGVEGRKGVRNSPSLANVAYHPYFMREGGVPTLEMQVLVPVQEHEEFDFNIVLLSERLRKDSVYMGLAHLAYGRDPDPFVITRAIACFERSLLSGNSRFDQLNYQHQADALSAEELRGMNLFFSDKTSCSSCHGGFNFTNYSFRNNGLYQEYADEGRQILTREERDNGKFKVPGLRNVALTAPYMHDGSLMTLMEVIEHYQSGGFDHQSKDSLIRPLDLTEQEMRELEAFLLTLTDRQFINNPYFSEE